MKKRTVEVTVNRGPSGYWAELPEFKGCFAPGATLDELFVSVHDSLSLYLGDHEPDRILARVTTLQLEIESDLRPADAEDITRPPPPPNTPLAPRRRLASATGQGLVLCAANLGSRKRVS